MPRHSAMIDPVPAAPATAPGGLVSVDGRTFPLEGAALTGRARGGLAETVLRQDYVNPHAEPLEALYTLPLPADGAVIGYTVTIGEKVITGEVQPVKEARAAYRRALEEGRTAGLLEQRRADTFSQALGSIPPGAAVQVEIRVLQPLAFLAGAGAEPPLWEYRFPTVVGVRYHGAPGRVPDAGTVNADRADGPGTPVRLALDLTVDDGGPEALAVVSPHHPLQVEPCGEGCRLRLAEAARLDRDLVIRWRASGEEVGLALATGGGLAGDDGRYGLVTVTPPVVSAATFARDLTVLIDASGSMSGAPLDAAKEVVGRLLDSLTATDRFEIVAFASRPHRLTGPEPVAATAGALRKARRALGALEAGGATEMVDAIHEVLSPLRPGSQRQVILITDGYIGFEGEVVGGLLAGLQDGCRLHAVGVGSAPNRSLTRGAARAGRGAEMFVTDGDDAGEVAGRLLAATVAPVLTDIEIGGSAVAACVPTRPRDVLAGQPLRAVAELKPAGGTLVVRARLAGSDEPWVRTLDVPSTGLFTSSLALGALYGREAVADAEMRSAAGMGSKTLADEIERLGMRHRIATSQTSLVAVADEPSVDPKAPRRRRKLEVELPAGVSAGGTGLMHEEMSRSRELQASLLGMSANRLSEVLGVDVESTPDESAFELSFDEMAESKHGWKQSPGWVREARSIEVGAGTPAPISARLVRREDDLLVLEFEVPADGWLLPAAGSALELKLGRRRLKGTVDDDTTSAPGPHGADLTVRLGIRLAGKLTAEHGTLRVTWTDPDGKVRSLAVDLRPDGD